MSNERYHKGRTSVRTRTFKPIRFEGSFGTGVTTQTIDYGYRTSAAELMKELKKSITGDLTWEASGIASEAISLLKKKHRDYGPNSISKAPGGALNGLVVRMHDKIERADNLIRKDVKPDNESLRDTFIDLLNYSIISLLVIDDKWDILSR